MVVLLGSKLATDPPPPTPTIAHTACVQVIRKVATNVVMWSGENSVVRETIQVLPALSTRKTVAFAAMSRQPLWDLAGAVFGGVRRDIFFVCVCVCWKLPEGVWHCDALWLISLQCLASPAYLILPILLNPPPNPHPFPFCDRRARW